jgi:hypothetical protein
MFCSGGIGPDFLVKNFAVHSNNSCASDHTTLHSPPIASDSSNSPHAILPPVDVQHVTGAELFAGMEVQLQVWECRVRSNQLPAHFLFGSIAPGCCGVVFAYDLNRPDTAHCIATIMQDMKENNMPLEVPVCLFNIRALVSLLGYCAGHKM